MRRCIGDETGCMRFEQPGKFFFFIMSPGSYRDGSRTARNGGHVVVPTRDNPRGRPSVVSVEFLDPPPRLLCGAARLHFYACLCGELDTCRYNVTVNASQATLCRGSPTCTPATAKPRVTRCFSAVSNTTHEFYADTRWSRRVTLLPHIRQPYMSVR